MTPIEAPIASKSSCPCPITKTRSASCIISRRACATTRTRTRVELTEVGARPPKDFISLPIRTMAWSPPRPKAKSNAICADSNCLAKVVSLSTIPIEMVTGIRFTV